MSLTASSEFYESFQGISKLKVDWGTLELADGVRSEVLHGWGSL